MAMNREDLERLTKSELIDLVLGLQRPDKTSQTSSKPPSTDRKERREHSRPGGAKPGHKGHARALAETPDAIEDHRPTHCLHCGSSFAQDAPGFVVGELHGSKLSVPMLSDDKQNFLGASLGAPPNSLHHGAKVSEEKQEKFDPLTAHHGPRPGAPRRTPFALARAGR